MKATVNIDDVISWSKKQKDDLVIVSYLFKSYYRNTKDRFIDVEIVKSLLTPEKYKEMERNVTTHLK